MQKIFAADFDIKPGFDVSEKLIDLFDHIKNIEGEKTVIFEKGEYYIAADRCQKHKLFITNTVSESEYKEHELPRMQSVAFYLSDIRDLVVDGAGSTWIIDGKITNIAAERCDNLTIKNIEIRHKSPDMHELKVLKKDMFRVDFQADTDSSIQFAGGKPYFCGTDYRLRADENAAKAFWTGLVRQNTPNQIKRTQHPLFTAVRYKDLGNNRIRAYFPCTARFKAGDRFYIYDARRLHAGIFINTCSSVILDHIKQRFNYSLAFVAQSSSNLTVKNCEFSPGSGPLKIASMADFMQICMCRGKVRVENNLFEGAGDDCVNVHGIHFKIVKTNNNQVTVRFMHPQSYGFNPLKTGDRIVFVDPQTLLSSGSAVIQSSDLLSPYEIRLTLDTCVHAKTGMVIEDTDACPDFDFVNNTVNRIITRGILITTRGKVNIKNNHFISTTMSGVLLSDDAKSWYESGPCRDVTIENNNFDYCGADVVLIKPENAKYKGAVHKNIRIKSNCFKKYSGHAVSAKNADSILIKENQYANGFMKMKNCNHVTADHNVKRNF